MVANFADKIYLNGQEVDRVYLDGVQVYPDFIPEIKAVISRAYAEGFSIPSNSTLWALNGLIKRTKLNGDLWDSRDCFYWWRYNDVSLSGFSRINLKNPSGDLLGVFGGMSYTTDGWLGNGVDGYLNTNWNPYLSTKTSNNNVNFSQMLFPDFSVNNVFNGITNRFGVMLNANSFYYFPLLGTNINQWIVGSRGSVTSVYTTQRVDDANNLLMRNKVNGSRSSTRDIDISDANNDFLINALNGATVGSYTVGTTGYFSAGSNITVLENSQLIDDMNILLTELELPILTT